MKKEIRKKAVIIGVVISALILCTVLILINVFSKQVNKISRLEEIETKQYSTEATVGTESELNEFTYTKDDTAKTVTLTEYNNTTNTSLTIHSKYLINGTQYSTIINKPDRFSSFFIESNELKTVIFQDQILIEELHSFFVNAYNLEYVDLGGIIINSMHAYNMFGGCANLKTVNFNNANFNKVTNMTRMFYGCSALTNLDLSNLDTSNVTSMSEMFYGCSALTNLDLSNLDTSNVTSMSSMFYGCSALTNLNLSNFNISNVTDMAMMFYECSALTNLNLSNWNISNVTNMNNMFDSDNVFTDLDLSNWIINGDRNKLQSILKNIRFANNIINLNLSNWDTSKVTDMNNIFNGSTLRRYNRKFKFK